MAQKNSFSTVRSTRCPSHFFILLDFSLFVPMPKLLIKLFLFNGTDGLTTGLLFFLLVETSVGLEVL